VALVVLTLESCWFYRRWTINRMYYLSSFFMSLLLQLFHWLWRSSDLILQYCISNEKEKEEMRNVRSVDDQLAVLTCLPTVQYSTTLYAVQCNSEQSPAAMATLIVRI
jgi:hypothetical protein